MYATAQERYNVRVSKLRNCYGSNHPWCRTARHLAEDSPCPPCLSRLNTEHTERLGALRVWAFPATEDTEEPMKRARIFAG